MDNLNGHKGGLTKTQLQHVVEYIDSHLDGALTVDELAHVACLSRYHFGKMFKQSMSTTLHQYVLAHRIERARELLSNRHNSLAEIALAAGFPTQSYFTTVFSSHIGITPAAYRRVQLDRAAVLQRQRMSNSGNPPRSHTNVLEELSYSAPVGAGPFCPSYRFR